MSTSLTIVNQIAEAMGGELLPDNGQYTNRMEIRSSSSDKLYIVAQRKSDDEWCCGCPGWIFKKKGQERNCKHLKVLRPLLTGSVSRQEIAAKPRLIAVQAKPIKKAAAKKSAAKEATIVPIQKPAANQKKLFESIAMVNMAGSALENLPLPSDVQKRYEKRLLKIQASIEALADDLRDEG